VAVTVTIRTGLAGVTSIRDGIPRNTSNCVCRRESHSDAPFALGSPESRATRAIVSTIDPSSAVNVCPTTSKRQADTSGNWSKSSSPAANYAGKASRKDRNYPDWTHRWVSLISHRGSTTKPTSMSRWSRPTATPPTTSSGPPPIRFTPCASSRARHCGRRTRTTV